MKEHLLMGRVSGPNAKRAIRLEPEEAQVHRFICEQFRSQGFTVSKGHIAKQFGIGTDRAHYALVILDRKGWIKIAPGGRFKILRDEEGDFVVPMLLSASVANRIDQSKVKAA